MSGLLLVILDFLSDGGNGRSDQLVVILSAPFARRDGSILNITSVVGLIGNAGQVNYAASKAGMVGMTKSVARELASRGVRCNAIAPGFIRTDMTDALAENQVDALMGQIPLARLGDPTDRPRHRW